MKFSCKYNVLKTKLISLKYTAVRALRTLSLYNVRCKPCPFGNTCTDFPWFQTYCCENMRCFIHVHMNFVLVHKWTRILSHILALYAKARFLRIKNRFLISMTSWFRKKQLIFKHNVIMFTCFMCVSLCVYVIVVYPICLFLCSKSWIHI